MSLQVEIKESDASISHVLQLTSTNEFFNERRTVAEHSFLLPRSWGVRKSQNSTGTKNGQPWE